MNRYCLLNKLVIFSVSLSCRNFLPSILVNGDSVQRFKFLDISAELCTGDAVKVDDIVKQADELYSQVQCMGNLLRKQVISYTSLKWYCEIMSCSITFLFFRSFVHTGCYQNSQVVIDEFLQIAGKWFAFALVQGISDCSRSVCGSVSLWLFLHQTCFFG